MTNACEAQLIAKIAEAVIAKIEAMRQAKPQLLVLSSEQTKAYSHLLWQSDLSSEASQFQAMLCGFEASGCELIYKTSEQFLKNRESLEHYKGVVIGPLSLVECHALMALNPVNETVHIVIEALRRGLPVAGIAGVLNGEFARPEVAHKLEQMHQTLCVMGIKLWTPSQQTSIVGLQAEVITAEALKGYEGKLCRVSPEAVLTYSGRTYALEKRITIERGR